MKISKIIIIMMTTDHCQNMYSPRYAVFSILLLSNSLDMRDHILYPHKTRDKFIDISDQQNVLFVLNWCKFVVYMYKDFHFIFHRGCIFLRPCFLRSYYIIFYKTSYFYFLKIHA